MTLGPYGKESRQVLLLYGAGFNSLSSDIWSNIDEIKRGYLPGKGRNDDVVLVFSHLTKNDLVATVFEQKFGVLGSGFIAVSIALFAFSTVLGWSHYGTKACEYLLGEKRTVPYRVIFVLLVFGGAVMGDNLAWDLADTFNGLMMIPNLIGVIALSGLVMKITRNYVDRRIRGKDVKPMLSAFPDIQQEQEAALADIDDQ